MLLSIADVLRVFEITGAGEAFFRCKLEVLVVAR